MLLWGPFVNFFKVNESTYAYWPCIDPANHSIPKLLPNMRLKEGTPRLLRHCFFKKEHFYSFILLDWLLVYGSVNKWAFYQREREIGLLSRLEDRCVVSAAQITMKSHASRPAGAGNFIILVIFCSLS